MVTYISLLSSFQTYVHPYTRTSTSVHQATFEVSNVHTPAYIYIVKNSKCPLFFGYLYKKKTFRAFRHPYTHTLVHFFNWPHNGIAFQMGQFFFEKKSVLIAISLARPFLGGPFLARPFLARPFLGGPFLGRPFLGGPLFTYIQDH